MGRRARRKTQDRRQYVRDSIIDPESRARFWVDEDLDEGGETVSYRTFNFYTGRVLRHIMSPDDHGVYDITSLEDQ